jgi:hypothetical protein
MDQNEIINQGVPHANISPQGSGKLPMEISLFSYTTRQAVDDGVLVKAETSLRCEAAIRFPVYVTDAVWSRYIVVPSEFEGIHDQTGRFWDILYMFAWQAKKCSTSLLYFKLHVQVPAGESWQSNEEKSPVSFQHREVRLKAVIAPQDIDDPSPAIFIMLPWED